MQDVVTVLDLKCIVTKGVTHKIILQTKYTHLNYAHLILQNVQYAISVFGNEMHNIDT